VNLQTLALVLTSVSMSAIAQIVLKVGMSGDGIARAIASGEAVAIASRIVLNPWVVGGLGIYVLGAMCWLFVLARIDVSMAYPFVGLGFVLTMLLGASLFGDHIGVGRLAGTALVSVGVILIARS
jgi:drug/metabolite transporter (DMT)-like permease